MIIHDIADLNLQIDKHIELEGGGYITIRGSLKDELEIGQTAYIENSENLIKRLSEEEYMFIRRDGVATHINKRYSSKDLNTIHKEINRKLDYDLKYAEDRVKLVNRLISQNEWLYDLISTNKLMEKEIKKKDSLLAENQRYDQIIDSINTYIAHANFKNKEDEEHHIWLHQEKLELEQKGKRNKTTEEFGQLNNLIDEIQNFHHKQIKKNLKEDLKKTNNKAVVVPDLARRESKGDFTYQEELRDRTKKAKFQFHKDDIPDEYWIKMYPSERKAIIPFYDKDLHNEELNKSIRHHDFRPQTLKQMKDEVEKLYEYFGFNIKDKLERKLHIERLKLKLGLKDYGIRRRMYTGLKADYELAKKILTNEFGFQISKHSTVYNIHSDTWYEDENGEIVNVSRNTILMNNADTYKGLLLNYKDLKDKYRYKQDSDWWALIKDFEDILSKTELTDDEQFVLDVLFDSYSQRQIKELYANLDLGKLGKNKISRIINEHIPNKLLNTYLDIVQDWMVVNYQMGKYKVCSKCEEPKLANERYFGKHPNSSDKLQSYCKKCDALRK